MKESPTEVITLSNGIRLAYVRSNSAVGHLAFYFKGGSRSEPSTHPGLAHFLEHSIFKGTHTRKAMWILTRLDEVGGELNAFTAKEEICVHATFLNRYTKRAFELMSDLVVNSNFPIQEIEKEKEVVIDEINSYKDSPLDRLMDEFDRIFFGDHPLGNPILGTKKSVKRFKREDLLAFIQSNFSADNLVVSYVGREPKQRLVDLIEGQLKDLPAKATNLGWATPAEIKPFTIRKKESNFQSHAILGGIAPSYHNDDRLAMNILINFLGGPAMNARLNIVIREKHGLAYHVEASYAVLEDTGFWGILLSAEQKNIDKSIELAKKELRLLVEKGMTPIQLKKSKYQFLSQLSIGWESNNARTMSNGKTLLIYNRIDSLEDTFRKINAITLEEINAVARKYFLVEQQCMLVYDKK
jgi:predicted Zn-dependent peptidase